MSELKFEVVEKCGVIGEASSGWTKELRIIKWDGRKAKYDIREWAPEDRKCSRGITLSDEEIQSLYEILKNRLS